MSQDFKLEVNLNVEIEVLDGPYKGTYKTVIDNLDANRISFGLPIMKGVPVPLGLNSVVKVTYMDAIAIYSFDGAIVDRVNDPRPLFTVAYPKEVKRIQRRSFVRCDVRFPLTFHKLSPTMEVLLKDQKAIVEDVSGGGLRLETETQLELGDLLDIYLDLPNKDKVIALGKVVRVFPKPSAKPELFSIGVFFEFIEERDRDKIMRFIFEKQRELRQKGLL